jgi:hypothetical protein
MILFQIPREVLIENRIGTAGTGNSDTFVDSGVRDLPPA